MCEVARKVRGEPVERMRCAPEVLRLYIGTHYAFRGRKEVANRAVANVRSHNLIGSPIKKLKENNRKGSTNCNMSQLVMNHQESTSTQQEKYQESMLISMKPPADVITENKHIINESEPHELGNEFALYRRIDEELLQANPTFAEANAVHGAMCKVGHIPRYEVYEKMGTQEIAVVVHVGDKLCGHPGIVHGGIISTIFDNSFGWLYIATKQKPAFTANLNINYRKPVFANSTAIIRAQITNLQGRKLFMSATWENKQGEIYADATTLFITPKTEISEISAL